MYHSPLLELPSTCGGSSRRGAGGGVIITDFGLKDRRGLTRSPLISRAIIIVGAEIGVNPNIAEPGYPGFIIRRFRFGVLFFKAPITDVFFGSSVECVGGRFAENQP